jgi:hypothetical protein
MKTQSFNEFTNEDVNPLQVAAQDFVKKELGLGYRENKIEEYANENDLNYLDFAGAVIDEIRRQFAM